MTAQSIVCGACAAEVPYGRLSCPSCGELLASVAGSRRTAAPPPARSAVPDVLYEPLAAPAGDVVDGQLATASAPRNVDAELPWGEPTTTGAGGDAYAAALARATASDPEDDGLPLTATAQPSSMAVPFGTAAGLNGSKTPSYMPRPGSRQPAAQPVTPIPDAEAMPAATFDPADLVDPAPAAVVPAAPPATAGLVPPAVLVPVEQATDPMPVVQASSPPHVAAAGAYVGPGAYVPPAPLPIAAVPAGMAAPAREWAGYAGEQADASTGGVRTEADTRVRVMEFTRWLSVAGSAFAAVGFLLPWGLVVIGSSDTGYFGRWGIAGSWHIVVAIAILANLGLALIENRVPVWLKTGLTGLGLGALLLGLVWPYLTLPALGTGPGALIAGIGAAALIASGILALVTDRHAEGSRPV